MDKFAAHSFDRAGGAALGGDPTKERYLTSYQARRAYQEKVQQPPHVFGVEGAIDIHCHAHEGQQDPLAIAKLASASGMKGILFKTLVGAGRKDLAGPAGGVREMEGELARWCDAQKCAPIAMWAGWSIGRRTSLLGAKEAERQLRDGVKCVWMPIALHANTLSKVGGKPIWWGASDDPTYNTEPLPWDEARKIGHYLLDDRGRLKDEVIEVLKVVADYDVALSFAHATHPEIAALAELVDKLGITKAFVDHPFSPFVDLTLAQMKQLTAIGIYMNFTYDEISPLLGVDPAKMCATIQALGTAHVTLSSDAGEPLFPNSVECMRLIRGHMRAFGLSDPEIHEISAINPARIVGMAA
jgi:hypothetical protein